MKEDFRTPLIVEFYEQFLVDRDTGSYIRDVSDRYGIASISKLCTIGSRIARRAAVLALGHLGDYGSNATLGRALNDLDRGVRTLAEQGIKHVWRRIGTASQRENLVEIIRRIEDQAFDEAIDRATSLIHQAPWFAEAWHQRAVAYFYCENYDAALRDHQQAIEINPYHFLASAGMGKCHLRLENRVAALECFRRALRLNSGMEDIRAHVVYLQRSLKEN